MNNKDTTILVSTCVIKWKIPFMYIIKEIKILKIKTLVKLILFYYNNK